MVDKSFIESILQKGREAKEKATIEFSKLSLTQLNWKPSPTSWSVAQCLQHLVISDNTYFSQLERIASGNSSMNFWEKYSPFTRLLGSMMRSQLKEEVRIKLKAPKKIQPTVSELPGNILEQYDRNLDRFLELISRCSSADVDQTVITSPITKVITYNLRDALQFLLQHEYRHLNQGIRLKNNENFPKN